MSSDDTILLIEEKAHDPVITDPEVIAKANALKDEGNALLAIHKYKQAIDKYTEAIELYPNAIFYSNRAQALIKTESYAYAVMDANKSIKLDPKYIKGYYRRGSANYAMGKLKNALTDFKAVVKIVPNDKEAQKKMKACDKAVREEAFSKALETESIPPVTYVDVDKIEVDEKYTGPRLPDDEVITEEFVNETINYFKDQKLLHRKYVMKLLLQIKDYLSNQPSLLRIPLPTLESENGEKKLGPIIVCGDTHGQFYDLLNIFELGGKPSETNSYLFNGDFVDRGSFSFETVMTIFMYKLLYPNSFYMLRGNHETKNMNKIYGFDGEVRHKYNESVMQLFSEVFSWLPLAAVIQDSIFVVHGGLSIQDDGAVPLSAIEALQRHREPPESGLFSDLLWADPQEEKGKNRSKRGLGFNFGPDITEAFLKCNNLKLVVRSHEVKDDGFVVEHGGKCITVFSAPNYCDQMGNKGAFIRFGPDLEPVFTKFSESPHPNVPPMRYAANIFGL
mmetsp:Transcript_24404/g.22175  ORF Transcript_24404/g.22175 Transcript_24404/m.22175 type:complete len:505 (-) Transcript_24404:30-1544(-)